MLQKWVTGDTRERVNELLINRQVSKEAINRLYEPELSSEKMNNMEEAASLLLKHIMDSNKIAVLFDTDVDGICAGTIMYRLIKRLSRAPLALINSSKVHGITEDTVNQCKENRVKLLIVVDAGTNDYFYQDKLNSTGVEVLVLDHHEIETDIEDGDYSSEKTIIVNCKDGKYDNKDLSGTGVVYKFAEYIEGKFLTEDPTFILDEMEEYVGISILSDVCSMASSENRYFVNKLLQRGIYSPFTKQYLKYGVSQTAFTFGLIPAINSMIRTGQTAKARDVFIYNSPQDVKKNEELGKNANKLQRNVLSEIKGGLDVKILDNFCFADITKIKTSLPPPLTKNFTGLTATIIREHFDKPTLVTIRREKLIGGSFRANDGANYRQIFNKGGIKALGHESAFGIISNTKTFSDSIKSIIPLIPYVESKTDYDYEMVLREINKDEGFIRGCAAFNELAGKNMPKIKLKVNIDRRFLLVDYYEKYYKVRIGGIEIVGFDQSKAKNITDYMIITPEMDDSYCGNVKFFLN